MPKRKLGISVLEAARERVSFVFEKFPKIFLSFSGGKDSTVMLHLVMEEAKRTNRKIGVLFIDWECQFSLTIRHIEELIEEYSSHIELYWVQLPILTTNGCSVFEPEWKSWDENKKELWVREKSPKAITNPEDLPFYYDGITFEEFCPLFSEWYAGGELCANFIGIRAQESLNRFRTIAREKRKFEDKAWTTNVTSNVWACYPIYDWYTEDDWTYIAKEGKKYNSLYDRMYQGGMTIHQMRIDEPFGDTQRQSLWLYQIVEPQTWAKMVSRVAGANTGALYSGDGGNILGNRKLSLPDGHTWKSFAELLLHTMPPPTAEHYKNKIAVFLKWYQKRGYPTGIPDFADRRLESGMKVPTWRLICKVLLKNDYWCRLMNFAPTKTSAYSKYMDLMKKRKKEWGFDSRQLALKDVMESA